MLAPHRQGVEYGHPQGMVRLTKPAVTACEMVLNAINF